ncbi:MAG: site-specific DNA-methyltransferase [Chloroflexi bacterium]|nr:site-specific DNA-methyltransferase [Chloroflexota bacterium]
MQSSVQLSLFEKQTTSSSITKRKTSEWGTFKDSLRAPIHRWFTYPAGFSYKAVEYSLNKYQISPGQTIYDPFMGSGTTNLVAKTRGIDSFGVEAHPFVYRIAQTKMNWNITREEVLSVIKDVRLVFQNTTHTMPDTTSIVLEEQFPELILKCYETDTLRDLFILR